LYSYHSDTMTPPPPSSALFPYATLFRSLQQFRVAESDCGKLFGSEIPVTEHPLETVHIDVCDVAHHQDGLLHLAGVLDQIVHRLDRKSTRLNSSHVSISYAVFCLKKKNN